MNSILISIILNYKLKHPKLNYGPDFTLHITLGIIFKGKH